MELSWNYHGIIMELSWNYHGIIMELSWNYYGIIMELSWNFSLNIYLSHRFVVSGLSIKHC